MEVYIDKSNLCSFINARKDQQYNDWFDDCNRMLKRQLDVKYNFSKKEILENELLKNYFSLSGDGCGLSESDIFSLEMIPVRPIKSNSSNQFDSEQHSAIFLIDDERTSVLQEKGTSLVGQLGQEIETLKQLFCGNDYDFHKLYNIQDPKSFPNWKQLSKDGVNLPLSDIIIMDRYIGSQEDLMEYNLIKLIEVLVEKVHGEVNLVLFCNNTYSWNGKEITPNWGQIRENIRKHLKQKIGITSNVTIIFFSKTNKKNNNDNANIDHDRIIFTNYMMYRSGDSFCYFDSKGRMISKGKSLDVNSLAKKSNYDFAMSFIEQAQKLYNEIKQKDNSDLIIGDKKSNYINF